MNEHAVNHCIETIRGLVEQPDPSRRDLLQLGYNLGRISELVGLDRTEVWDLWKAPVTVWEQDALRSLSVSLAKRCRSAPGS
jgi:hypothetical protein